MGRTSAKAIGMSKEWTTAGCLGQMTFTKDQAGKIGEIFSLSDEAVAWLQIVPSKGSLAKDVPVDPLIYRFHELSRFTAPRSRPSFTRISAMAS